MALTVFSQNLFSTSYRSSRHFFATREKNSKVPNMYSYSKNVLVRFILLIFSYPNVKFKIMKKIIILNNNGVP